MANENAPHTNTSQFFITLDACEHLKVRFLSVGVGKNQMKINIDSGVYRLYIYGETMCWFSWGDRRLIIISYIYPPPTKPTTGEAHRALLSRPSSTYTQPTPSHTPHPTHTLAYTPFPFLQGKHTIFGKVTGDTIFNVLRMGEAPTDLQDRPLEPIKVEWIEVLANPFDDIVPR